jgi:hypothetical protein
VKALRLHAVITQILNLAVRVEGSSTKCDMSTGGLVTRQIRGKSDTDVTGFARRTSDNPILDIVWHVMDAVVSNVPSNTAAAVTLVIGSSRAPVEFAAPTGPSSLSCMRVRCSATSAGSVSQSRKEGVTVVVILVLDDFERAEGLAL